MRSPTADLERRVTAIETELAVLRKETGEVLAAVSAELGAARAEVQTAREAIEARLDDDDEDAPPRKRTTATKKR